MNRSNCKGSDNRADENDKIIVTKVIMSKKNDNDYNNGY